MMKKYVVKRKKMIVPNAIPACRRHRIRPKKIYKIYKIVILGIKPLWQPNKWLSKFGREIPFKNK